MAPGANVTVTTIRRTERTDWWVGELFPFPSWDAAHPGTEGAGASWFSRVPGRIRDSRHGSPPPRHIGLDDTQ